MTQRAKQNGQGTYRPIQTEREASPATLRGSQDQTRKRERNEFGETEKKGGETEADFGHESRHNLIEPGVSQIEDFEG
jgi:hypothetical protein